MPDDMTAAEEVAEDYKRELEELSGINRAEISTLTMIARESTEHAMAISEVLVQHILNVAPSKKLPALYVLDSIVKNVGTPYTLYTARSLYKLFMESYAVVDHGVRRKMEEMLNTWKGPVPGSIDTRPVFPSEVVVSIENALYASRASAAQRLGAQKPLPPPMQQQQQNQHQHQQQGGGGGGGGRGGEGPYPTIPSSNAQARPGMAPPYRGGSLPPPPPSAAAPADASIDSLNSDIENLMVALQARRSIDASPQTGVQLMALGQLKELVQRRDLSPEQLSQVRNQVAQFAVNVPTHARLQNLQNPQHHASPQSHSQGHVPPQHHAPQNHGPGHAHPPPQSHASQHPPPPPQNHTPPPYYGHAPVSVAPPTQTSAPPATSIDALLGKGALAALLAARATPPAQPPFSVPPPFSAPLQQLFPSQPPFPTSSQPPFSPQPPYSAPQSAPQPMPAPTPTPQQPVAPRDPMTLLAELRRAGLMPQTPIPPTPTPPAPVPPPAAAATPPMPAAASMPQNPLQLMEQLRRAGMLPPAQATSTPPPQPAQLPGPADLARILGLANAIPDGRKEGSPAPLASLALKSQQFRPQVLSQLFESLGPACNMCGRRFRTDEAGRRRKTAHMDWHFHERQRQIEADQRGQNRCWNIDVQDWIKARETVDALHTAEDDELFDPERHSSADPPTYHPLLPANNSTTSTPVVGYTPLAPPTNPTPVARRKPIMPVPEATSRMNRACPVCKEKFANEYHAPTQEWVWMDVVLVHGRAYHADCRPRKRGASEMA